jgi:diketogulonate reductase-like aldo/keto reductase
MAYTPIDQGRLGHAPLLRKLAEDRHCSATQIALAWVLAQPGVIAIPKAVSAHHLQENWDAQLIALAPAELARLDARFPPPKKKVPLATV